MVDLCNARSGVHRFLYLPTFRCPYRNTSCRTSPYISYLVSRNIGTVSTHQEVTSSCAFSTNKTHGDVLTLPEERSLSKVAKCIKVTVLGAAGRVGEALSLMLKQSPYIDKLALHDLYSTKGIALDLSLLDSKCEIFSYCGKHDLEDALEDANVVVIAAAVPFRENRAGAKRFCANAEVVAELTEACVKTCPQALIAVLVAPVNSTVPVACETVKRVLPDVKCPTRVFGVTTLDVVYANTYMAQYLKIDPQDVYVPVIGGSSGQTVVPVFSQTSPQSEVSVAEAHRMTKLVQDGVSDALAHKPSDCLPTMTLAFAAARFTISLCKACIGLPGIVECSYVPMCDQETPPYLANPVEIGPQGILRSRGIPPLSIYEKCVFDRAVEALKEDIDRGVKFMAFAPTRPVLFPDKKTKGTSLFRK